MTRPLKVDHLRLIRSAEYVEITADAVAAAPGFASMEVVHEADGVCCRVQPWPVTLDNLLGSVASRRGRSSLSIRAEGRS